MKIISAFLLFLILGCSNHSNPDYAVDSVMSDMEFLAEIPVAKQSAPPPPPSSEVMDVTDNSSNEEQKIIKTAYLVFETQNLETTHQHILELTTKFKGVIQNDNSGKNYNRIFKNLTIRVPTENFQEFIADISEGIKYFDQRTISRQDVSEEFVDLEARLKAKRTLEERYLELLNKANTVKEMLEIERELSNIREEIEARQGRLQYLQNQVSMSTVNIEFYKTTAETGITQSYGQKMKNALRGGWNGISVLFLGILYLWPLFLVAVIIVIILRIFLKNRKYKNSKN